MTNVMASAAGEAAVAVLKEVRGLLTAQYTPEALAQMAAGGADPTERRKQRIPDLMLDMHDAPTNLRSTKLADTKVIHANESNYKRDMVAAPTRGRAADARQEKVAGEYVTAVRAMDRKARWGRRKRRWRTTATAGWWASSSAPSASAASRSQFDPYSYSSLTRVV
jgi:hypothetical protein